MARDRTYIPQTCPKIDKVISFMESIEFTDEQEYNVTGPVKIMEEIRSANSDLRDLANEHMQKCEDLEIELRDMESENESLRREVEDLKNEIKEIEYAKED